MVERLCTLSASSKKPARRVAENLPKTICNLRPDGTKTCEATDQYSNLALGLSEVPEKSLKSLKA